jgi:hypothetical protein
MCVIGGSLLIIAAVITPFLVNNSVKVTDSPISLVGTWTGESSTTKMVATVSENAIEIMWETPDTTALYWKGTFEAPAAVSNTNRLWITSNGDTAAMENSLLASRDPTKRFTYEDGMLSFPLTVMGVTTTIKMTK